MLFPAVYLEAVQVWQLQFLVHTLGLILQKVVDLSNSPVEGNDSVTVVRNVQDQVLTHDGQTDETKIYSTIVSIPVSLNCHSLPRRFFPPKTR